MGGDGIWCMGGEKIGQSQMDRLQGNEKRAIEVKEIYNANAEQVRLQTIFNFIHSPNYKTRISPTPPSLYRQPQPPHNAACASCMRSQLIKIIMQVSRERNPYLKRIFSEQPHKYSYDIETGQYLLVDQEGRTIAINPTGTLRPKFKPNYSGFVNHKARYNDAPLDPALLHFAPDPAPATNYHNPRPDKFAGYAQCPYKISKELPHYLKKPGSPADYPRKKAQSLILGKEEKRANMNTILQYSSVKWKEAADQSFFNNAWTAMEETKPLPKQKKRTCYNYKCKFMKQWVFDERAKVEARKVESSRGDRTHGKSFHENALQREMQESKLLSTMALSGVAS